MKILVVDDDELIAISLKNILEEDGYIVDIAINGKIAIEKFMQSNVNLVITDIVMPIMDGIELLMWFKSHHPTVGLIALSGGGIFESKDYLYWAKELGANYVLAKPFSPKEIKRVVNDYFNLNFN